MKHAIVLLPLHISLCGVFYVHTSGTDTSSLRIEPLHDSLYCSITAIHPVPGAIFRLIASTSTVLDDGSKSSKEGLPIAGRSRALVAEFAIPKLGLSIAPELFSDKSIVCISAGPFVFGMWQKTRSECNPQMFPKATPYTQPGSIAFIEANIHYAELIERIVKGRIDRVFTPKVQAMYTDDVDKKFGWLMILPLSIQFMIKGLHYYRLVLALRTSTSTVFSHRFDLFRARNEQEITARRKLTLL